MGRINDLTRWLVMNINFCFSTIAVFSMGFIIFALTSEWGDLDRGFFLGGGIAALFFWLLLFLISVLLNLTHDLTFFCNIKTSCLLLTVVMVMIVVDIDDWMCGSE